MGSRGPAPKRSTERAGHRTKAEQPDQVTVSQAVTIPPADPKWRAAAKRWYESLQRSGQKRYFEPSDWEYARLLAQLLSDEIASGSPRATMMKTILAAMGELGTTESARRRMRIEVERPDAPTGEQPEETGKVAVLDRYRRAFAS
jgi:hypothetical protein